MGYGPRMLLRILRLQRFLQTIEREPTRTLAQLGCSLQLSQIKTSEFARHTEVDTRTPQALTSNHLSPGTSVRFLASDWGASGCARCGGP